MAERRIWDISQPLHAGIPIWPGEPAVAITRHAEISDQCPVNVGAISMGLHTGTHGDAPLHYDGAGAACDAVAIAPYIGPCCVVDARHAGEMIEVGDLDWNAITGESRVLFRTYDNFPHTAWDENFTAISAAVVARLSAMGAVLIGSDAPSLDPQNSKTMDAHHAVRAGDMRILEGLVLDDVPFGGYELIALPLAIAGGDASPVRAILRELG